MSDLFERAYKGDIFILNDPDVDKVKDDRGYTPLHHLAIIGRVEVLNHPSIDKVKDNYDCTPLHYLADRGRVSTEWIIQKYPWYAKEITVVTFELIEEILNTPHSMRFINE